MEPDDSDISKDRLKLAKDLIDKGADTDSTSTFDMTRRPNRTNGPPLFFTAAYVKSDSCVQRLLEAGTRIDLSLVNVKELESSNPRSLLMALFYYRFSSDCHSTRGPIPARISLKMFGPSRCDQGALEIRRASG